MRRLAESLIRTLWARDPSPAARALSLALVPLEFLYRGGVALRNAAYDRGWLSTVEAPVPVVSVGNLSVGGTGKTPVSAWIARLLADRGRAPALVSRGYGKDELSLHRRWNPDVPVVADPDRVRAARSAALEGRAVVVLDDGFQHRRLSRALDLVLLAVEDPWVDGEGRERLLPRGPLREPSTALHRADWVLLTRRVATERRARRAEARIRALAPELRVARVRLAPRDWVTLDGREAEPPPGAMLAVTGIARPRGFGEMVKRTAPGPVELMSFPDHHPFTPADLRSIGERAAGRPVVTTEKDAVRLVGLPDRPDDVRVLRLRVEVETGKGELRRALLATSAGRPTAGEEAGDDG